MKVKAEAVPGIVTAAAFIASAAHIVKVVDQTNPLLVALVYPVGIDGLIYVGIGAMQKGRKTVGALALLVGSLYSLLFNAQAEGALTMPKLLIAASMPVCLFASFLIEYTGRKPAAPEVIERIVEKVVEVPVEVVRTVTEYPTFLPIAPPAAKPAPRKPAAPRAPRPTPTEVGTKTAGRAIGWDVVEAVRLMDEIADNETVGTKVGVAPKQIQRARRVLGFVRSTDMTDAEIRETIKNQLSIPTIAAIREAA